MGRTKIYHVDKIHSLITDTTRPTRKHCNADALIKALQKCFLTVPDARQANKVEISMADALMSAFAMFSLKDPSLLAFDKRRKEEPENLHSVFGIKDIACDSQMRAILDSVNPESLQCGFQEIFRILQRGKDLESMTVLGGYHLVSGDGTGFYSSTKISSDGCLQKNLSNGTTLYHQQMYAAAIVHPDHREVIPFHPEMITQQDGKTKQDCEREAARRFYREFRRIHPHLKVIVTEDGLGSNGPHIRDLQELDLRYILGAKPGDHQFLFEQIDAAAARSETTEWTVLNFDNTGKDHSFRFINGVVLNKSNPDLLVNVLEYWEVDKVGKLTKFSWVTDLTITKENAFEIMRAGRARWRIENETFNTLKNQGYNLGHNYGLGEKHLGAVFATLMMLAFLMDQAQQLSCWLFRAAWQKAESKRALWEKIRNIFQSFPVDSMETILRCIAYGIQGYLVEVIDEVPTG
jgi:hypothetical protein